MLAIAVLTPSLPERTDMLAEAMASVRAQTLSPEAHLIGIDHSRAGIGPVLNALAAGTDAEWLARLDDDDLFDEDHLEALAASADDADIVYSWCRIAPREPGDGKAPTEPSVVASEWWMPNREFDADLLRKINYIPATTLIRKALWEEIGGWRLPGFGLGDGTGPESAEDWDFWIRALDAGARFRCVPRATWTYRYHGENLWFR